MTLQPGQSLAHYRLGEKIGEGGMGAVYRATDSKLGRDVAIKILPEAFAAEPDRLARFEREARVLASLSHPNIAGIFGIHEEGGVQFLAMELVAGEDLSQRLARGPIPPDEALPLALQIASALEAAHESGVIHRDLKPANIKLAADGTVKVLDFGLAKALTGEPAEGSPSTSLSPTLTVAGTMAGMILGTAAYMSPEQAKGKAVDRRADIWSFGVVLLEMLTGRRTFEGETVSETLAAVMMVDIDFERLPAGTPRKVRELLRRCLQRDPRRRLRDIGDARILLEEAIASPGADDQAARAGEATAGGRAGRLPAWLPWTAAALALAGLAWLGLRPESVPPPAPVLRFEMPVGQRFTTLLGVPALALSPDGSRLVFAAQEDGVQRLFLRQMQDTQVVPLPGTEDADYPFFSPDGQWIAFNQDGHLKKLSLAGGSPVTLCEAPRLRGADWGEGGLIVFSPDRSTGLMLVSESGGTPEPLTTIDSRPNSTIDPSHRWPRFLPDGRTVIYTAAENNSQYSEAEIMAISLDDRQPRSLLRGGTFPQFVAPDMLVYLRESTLYGARLDPERAELKREGVPVLEGLSYATFYGSAQLSISRSGHAIYFKVESADMGEDTLIWLDRDGNETTAASQIRRYEDIALSPDGRRVAMTIGQRPAGDIWLLDLERDSLTRLTFSEFDDAEPIWSPDGEWIVFSSYRDELSYSLYRMRADGSGEVERLTQGGEIGHFATSFSPDGKMLAFDERGGDSIDLSLLHLEAEPRVEPFLKTPFSESQAEISPDGRWVAYVSDEAGENEIYLRPLSGPGGKIKVSTGTRFSNQPRWSPDGSRLTYRRWDEGLMEVSIGTGENGLPRPGAPTRLFDYKRYYAGSYSVAPDGDRWLTAREVTGAQESGLLPIMVVNWAGELDGKVPAGK